ncbi:DUF1631 domain-containing protein [Pseudoxanthomonas daejeonensis]|uniref:DUF1631 family protein n=1 Tax=Pseudoxanthomonas daejeonensis TaxID=266062 RepID=UPI001F5419D7|nr:DUF1631 family protein [Pseudoxanthomonas daejeonensis]UNK58063.1 DUF1631 domain-containing protein [Pseudoxanthomonas daejeonensis]
MQTPPLVDELPSRNLDLLNQVRESILLPLADAFAAELDGIGSGLFELADKAPPALQKDYFDAIQELRRERESLVARFRAHLAKAWQALEAGRPLSVERTLSRGNDLTLVADTELEVRLAVRNLAGAIQQQWRPELMRLDRYLGFIAGGFRLDGDSNPIGPEHLGVAVYAAFSTAGLATRAQLASVRLCEPGMVERVGILYEGLERQLLAIARNVDLPEGRSRRRGIPGQPAAMRESPDWISRFFSQWQGGQRPGPGNPIDVHARGDHELLPAELHRLLQGARTDTGPDASGAGARPLSPRELASALSLLQTAPHGGFDEIDAAVDLRTGLHREVLAHAVKLGVDPGTVRIDPGDADTLDLVAMLFQALLAESQLRPELRPVLGQLLAPVAKVALQDPRLFVRDSHPVRRLLNMLADACDGNPAETAAELALLAQVQGITARVVRDFDEHLGVFLQAEAEFGAYHEQYRRRVEIAERRAAELQRAEERRLDARARAGTALDARLRGRTVPPVLEDFLRRPWLQHFERIALREAAADGPLQASALKLADGLLSASDGPAGRDDAWLEAQRPVLQRIYSEAGLAAAPAGVTAGALLDVLLGLQAADLPPPELPPAPAAPVAIEDAADSPLPEESPEQLGFDIDTAEYFQALPLGTWLDFIDRLGRVQPGKLAWVSPISGRRMFVNRRGSRFCVASPEQLAAMVQLGRLRLHREEDAFYSAMQSVVDFLDMPAVAA